MSGILLLDKPQGITSNGALQAVKAAFRARKAGHTGSLDPIATGLLPLCLGEATKISSFFLDADKRYRTVFQLGVATQTGDAEGTVVRRCEVTVDDGRISAAMDRFRGEINQTPPMYSAIKQGGQPLYKLARQGIEVERQPRRVVVYSLEWTRPSVDRLELDIHCSSGFYVRGLAQDLGEELGCGAHVAALRRTAVGQFSVDEAVGLDEILATQDVAQLDRLLIPTDKGLRHLPGVTLSADAAFYLCRGQAVRAANLPDSGPVRLYADEAGFLGVGEVLDDGRVAPKRLFHMVD